MITVAGLTGFIRSDDRVGIRNQILVLPSVVCSSHAARAIAEAGPATAIAHQHGCLHVGDDLDHTMRELVGAASNPNIAAVVVVSLGCETLNAGRLAREIRARGPYVELVGIQARGIASAIEQGRAAVRRCAEVTTSVPRRPVEAQQLHVGVDASDDEHGRAIVAALADAGFTAVRVDGKLHGAEAHVSLAGAGAQMIVSYPPVDEAAIGFAICPIVAVGRDAPLHRALADDFDLIEKEHETPAHLAARVVQKILAHVDGAPTAAEQRGARDFVLHRLAMSM